MEWFRRLSVSTRGREKGVLSESLSGNIRCAVCVKQGLGHAGRKDDAEGDAILRGLWGKHLLDPTTSATLEAFLCAFISRHSHVDPLHDIALFDSHSVGSPHVTNGHRQSIAVVVAFMAKAVPAACDVEGHNFEMVIDLARLIGNASKTVVEDVDYGNTDRAPMRLLSLLIRACAVLAAYSHNRSVLVHHDATSSISRIVGTVIERLTFYTCGDAHVPRTDTWCAEAIGVAAVGAITLERLVDPGCSWRRHLTTWEAADYGVTLPLALAASAVATSAAAQANPLSPRELGTPPSTPTSFGSPPTPSAMSTFFVSLPSQSPAHAHVVEGLVDGVRSLDVIGSRGDGLLSVWEYALRELLLHATGALCWQCVPAQNKLRECGGLEVIVGVVGWRKALETALGAADVGHMLALAPLEFRTQVVAWRVLRAVTAANAVNNRRLSAMEGFQRTIDFFLWTATVGPLCAPDGTYAGLDQSPVCLPLGASRMLASRGSSDSLASLADESGSIRGRPLRQNSSDATQPQGNSSPTQPIPASEAQPSSRAVAKRKLRLSCADCPLPLPEFDVADDEWARAARNVRPQTPDFSLPASATATPELLILYRMLLSACIAPASAQVYPAGPLDDALPQQGSAGGVSALQSASTTPHVGLPLSGVILDMYLPTSRDSDVNRRARAVLRDERPELQLLAVEFFVRLLGSLPTVISVSNDVADAASRQQALVAVLPVLSQRGVGVLFGDVFCGGSQAPALVLSGTASCETESLRSKLCRCILDLLPLAACIRGGTPAVQCDTLLTLMRAHIDQPRVVRGLSVLLIRAVCGGGRAVREALASLDFITSTLLPVLKLYAPSGSETSLEADARMAVLSLVRVFAFGLPLTSDDATPKWPAFVFSCRRFGLQLIAYLSNLNTSEALCDWILARMAEVVRAVADSSSSNFAETTSGFLTSFLDVFTSLPHGGKGPIRVRVGMMACMRSMTSGDTQQQMQGALIEAGCFVRIVSLLTTESGSSDPIGLCGAVIATLTSLMESSDAHKERFKRDVGYEHLRSSIFLCTEGHITREIVVRLFDMLVDGSFSLSKRYTVTNPDVVFLLLEISGSMDADTRTWLLEMLFDVVAKSFGNRTQFCDSGVISYLVGRAPVHAADADTLERIARLIELLGGHSMTASELKTFVGMLRLEGGYRPTYALRMLEALQRTIRKDGPLRFFDFPVGDATGIDVPRIEKWSSGAGGFTFSAWVRLEPFDAHALRRRETAPSRALPYEPRLYAFCTSKGEGFEAYISPPGHLSVAVISKGERKSVKFDFQFDPCKWYCVAIVHAGSRKPWVQSEVRLYVNGVHVAKSVLRVFSSSDPLVECRFACGSDRLSPATRTSLCGQMGAIYMFSDALTPTHILGVHGLGPNYSSVFQPMDAPNHPGFEPLFDGSLSSRLLLSYNAKACMGQVCVDLTPRASGSSGRVKMDALLRGCKCVTRHVKDAINSLGGMQMLLILLAHLDRPTQRAVCGVDGGPASLAADYSVDARLTTQFFRVIAEVIRGDATTEDLMAQCRGFATINVLLLQMHPGHVSADTFQPLWRLAETVSNAELRMDILRYIVFDFRLWIYGDISVHSACVQAAFAAVSLNHDACRHLYGVRFVLDTLSQFYWYSPEHTFSYATEPAKHSITGEVVGRRLSNEDVRTVRMMLLSMMGTLLNESTSRDDAVAITSFLCACGDAEQVAEVLDFILQIITSSRRPHVADVMAQHGGPELYYGLLCSPSDRVRTLALRTATVLVSADRSTESKHRKRLRLEETGFHGVRLVLSRHPLSTEVLEELLDLACEGTPLCRNPGPLCASLSLLSVADLSVRFSVLTRAYRSIRGNGEACVAMLKQAHWPAVMLEPLANVEPAASMERGGASVLELTLDVAAAVLWGVMETERKGWKALEDFLLLLERSKAVGDTVQARRDLLERVLCGVAEELKRSEAARKNPVYVNNVVHCLLLVEEFVFMRYAFDSSLRQHGTPHPKYLHHTHPHLSHPVRRESAGAIETGHSGALALPPTRVHANSLSTVSDKQRDRQQQHEQQQQQSTPPRHNAHAKSTNGSDDVDSEEDAPSERWDDVHLALRILGIADLLNLTYTVSYGGADIVGGGKSHLRVGGVLRLSTKVALRSLFHHDVSVCDDAVRRLQLMIEGPLADAPAPRAMHVLSTVNKALLASRRRGLGNHCRLASLMRVAMRKYRGVITPSTTSGQSSPTRALSPEMGAPLSPGLTVLPPGDFSDEPSDTDMEWHRQFARVVDRHSREYESADLAVLMPYLSRRRARREKALSERLDRSRQIVTQSERRFEEAVSTYWNTRKQAEDERRQHVTAERENDRRVALRQWRASVQFLTGERGAFAPRVPVMARWKLDRTENFSRMRRKLTRNYEFNDHSEASRGRDEGLHARERRLTQAQKDKDKDKEKDKEHADDKDNARLSGDVSAAGVSLLTAEVDALLNLSLSVRATGDTDEDNVAEDDWSLVSQSTTSMGAESPNGGPLAASASASASVNPALLSLAQQLQMQQSEERLVYATQCELVSLMTVTPGRIELTTHNLCFYASRPSPDDKAAVSAAASKELSDPADTMSRDFKWPLDQIREIHLRRYMLRRSALEIFLVEQTNYFINFERRERNRVYTKLLSLRPPNLIYSESRSPAELLRKSGLTQKWQRGLISNFDYLMQLNTIAGRTYNDLNQYPVFPWVIADYESPTLDLSNPKTFRDLAKPVGALNEKRLEFFDERYNSFVDPSGVVDKFHYGTHYSTSATVMYYLIRVEPFTTLHIQLQGGKFDHANRQFFSVPSTWHSVMTSTSDVKELIPEFFYFPEFLENQNNFDLGVLQAGPRIGDVVLPPWASSPEEFIRLNRLALESEYVSERLHEWIDLIFGHKQRGPAAVEAKNVFYYVTYEGAIDLDAIQDPTERAAIEAQINNFGQTPCQLLRRPHPKRLTAAERAGNNGGFGGPMPLIPASRRANTFLGGTQSTASMSDRAMERTRSLSGSDNSNKGGDGGSGAGGGSGGGVGSSSSLHVPGSATLGPSTQQQRGLRAYEVSVSRDGEGVAYVGIPETQLHAFMYNGMPDRVVTIGSQGTLASHGWLPATSNSLAPAPFTFDADPLLATSNPRRIGGGPFAQDVEMSSKLFCLSHDGKFVISGGHWDNSFRVTVVDSGKTIQSIAKHNDVVTCLATDESGKVLVTGSADTTLMMWETVYAGGTLVIDARPFQTLYGHDAEVLCVAINTELDVIVSGSKDGTCIVHTVRQGRYVRTLLPPRPEYLGSYVPQVTLAGIAEHGAIVVHTQYRSYTQKSHFGLHVFSINGKLLASATLEDGLAGVVIGRAGDHLVSAGEHGTVAIHDLHSLQTLYSTGVNHEVQTLSLSPSEAFVMLGLKTGNLVILTAG